MRVFPITIQNNTNFKSKIIKTQFLNHGFDMAIEETNSPLMKDLNRAKGFYDSIRTIAADTSKATFEINAEEKSSKAIKNVVATVDGKDQVVLNNKNPNLLPGYLCATGINKYASEIKQKPEETYLDELQRSIAKLQEQLSAAQNEYAEELQRQLKIMKNNI